MCLVDHDIAPADDLALGDCACCHDTACKTDGQRPDGEAFTRRHEPAPHLVAALTIEHLARTDVGLGNGDDVGHEALRCASGLAAQRRRENRDIELEPDQMIGPHKRTVAPALVGDEAILAKAGAGVVVGRLENHKNPPAQMIGKLAALHIMRGDDLDNTRRLENASLARRLEPLGQLAAAARHERKPALGHRQTRGVGNRRHLDGRLGAVEERIEHLRVHARGLGFFRIKAIVLPDGLGRRILIAGQVFRPFASGNDMKPAGPGPGDELDYERRLIAVGHAVNDTSGARLAGEHGACQAVGFDIDHHHMPGMRDRGAGVSQPC